MDNSSAFEALGRVRFNSIVVIESLPDKEVQTGAILYGYIDSVLRQFERPVKVFHRPCLGVEKFRQLLIDLNNEVSSGLRPILHIESHGSETRGLHFADDSQMSWDEFCDLTTPLNKHTDFGLVVAVSACYGFNLLSGVRLKKHAPWLLLIGPSDEVNPAELMGLFRSMYRAMIETLDAGPTLSALLQADLEQGHMMFLSAPYWFHLMMSKYLDDELTPKGIKAAASRMHARAKAEGSGGDIRYYKRLYRNELSPLMRDWFERYFMYSEIPQNRLRYERLWPTLDAKVKAGLRR